MPSECTMPVYERRRAPERRNQGIFVSKNQSGKGITNGKKGVVVLVSFVKRYTGVHVVDTILIWVCGN